MATTTQNAPTTAENTAQEEDIDALADYNPSDDEDESKAPKTNDGVGKETQGAKAAGNQTAFLNTSFRDFLLRPELLRAIADSGFEMPSPVQSKALPQSLVGTDILCQAKAGTGKTAIFVLSVLQQLAQQKGVGTAAAKEKKDKKDNEISCMVLCHNRELAYQIYDEFNRFLKYLSDSITCHVFFGGVDVEKDRKLLKEEGVPDIAIGTPGRVLQLVKEGTMKLGSVKYFVIDECDQVLEQLDMRGDVQRIFKETPRDKQVLMFSATLTKELKGVCTKFMHSPLEIVVEDQKNLVLHSLNQYIVELKEEEKTRKLLDLLDELEFNQVMVFVSSQARAEALAALLKDQNFPCIAMWGKLKQDERIKRFKEFKEFKHRIMVSTNMLGRGIDVVRVNVVINYDMPESVEMYLHRVGRAGRFSTKGLAISFLRSGDKEEKDVLNKVREKCLITIPELPDKIDPSTYRQKS